MNKFSIHRACAQRRLIKVLLMTKLVLCFITASLLQANARTMAQHITLSAKQADLKTLFTAIRQQSGYHFVYTQDMLKNGAPVSIDVKDADIQTVLEKVFENQPLVYTVEEKTVIVKEKEKSLADQTKDFFTDGGKEESETAQQPITGRVVDSTGIPIRAVTVRLQNTNRGTFSDGEGRFSLTVSEGDLLIFTGVGYEKKEVRVTRSLLEQAQSSGFVLSVILSLSSSPLDEVKIIGYGTTTQRYATGSVSKVTSEEIEKQPITNPLQALSGRVSGLTITQSNGLPGAPIAVQIRGRGSIGAGTTPLYIVDGVPFPSDFMGQYFVQNFVGANGATSALNSINPFNIESIDILKDADATAIYGSRGSNGVILITTKKGKAGKTKVDFNLQNGVGSVTRLSKLLNTQQYLMLRREGFKNDEVIPTVNNAPDLMVWDTTRYTDWPNIINDATARNTDASVSLSGGEPKTTFIFTGSYHHETPVLPGDFSYNRGGGHLNVNHNSSDDKFNASMSVSYTMDQNILPISDINSSAWNFPPDFPSLYDSAGNLNWDTNGYGNPFSSLQQIYKTKTNNLATNLTSSYQILPGLKLNVRFGYSRIETNQISTTPLYSLAPTDYYYSLGARATYGGSSIGTYIIEPQANYTKTSFDKGKFDLLVGGTWQRTDANGYSISGQGYPSDDLLESLSAAGTINSKTSNNYQYRYASAFGKLSYNWDDKYILNGSFRRDGSSRFGPGTQFGNFGAIGAAWLFSNENFIKRNTEWLNYGKLRGSYGLVGNDQIPDYQYLATYSSYTSSYGSSPTLYPTRIANPNYSWEINKKLEMAVELGFFKDKILFTSAWFRNRTGNQLVGYSLSPQTGFSSYQANLPVLIQNTGLEFELNTVNVQTKNLQWTSSMNITVPKNELISFPGLASSSYANSYIVGQPLSIIIAYHYIGVDPQTGIASVEDVDGNGSIAAGLAANGKGDQIAVGTTYPDFYGGFRNTVVYKRWSIDIFFQFSKQQGYKNGYNVNSPIGSTGNNTLDVLNRWQKPGDITNTPKATATSGTIAYSSYRQYSTSDYFVVDASYVRLKNLSLAYTIPDNLTNRIKMKSCKLFVEAQNLLTITNFMGFDPETATTGKPVVPPLRVITTGIQCVF